MAKIKPKEPLLSVLLSVILVGLGQIYSTKVLRGILFLAVRLALIAVCLYFILAPNVKINPSIYLLLLASLFFQLYTIVDAYFCAKGFNKANHVKSGSPVGVKILLVAGILIFLFVFNPSHAIPLYIKANIVQSLRVSDVAMEPVILKGDRIFIDRAIYKKSSPVRGDVVVYRKPNELTAVYIARVIGLPGENIELKDGKVLINGAILYEPQAIAKIFYDNKGTKGQEGGVTTIPEGNYYVLGDNSTLSKDSRFFGSIPRGYIAGKAYKIFMPLERSGPIK